MKMNNVRRVRDSIEKATDIDVSLWSFGAPEHKPACILAHAYSLHDHKAYLDTLNAPLKPPYTQVMNAMEKAAADFMGISESEAYWIDQMYRDSANYRDDMKGDILETINGMITTGEVSY